MPNFFFFCMKDDSRKRGMQRTIFTYLPHTYLLSTKQFLITCTFGTIKPMNKENATYNTVGSKMM